MVYIAIVDDKKSILYTLRDKLNRFPGYRVLFTASNGKDFLESMRKARQAIEPDVVLMDIDMPLMNGIEAVTAGKLRYPKTKYLMLTIFDEDEKIFNAIKAGASGYLLKDEPVKKIKEAIDDLLQHDGVPMSPSIARRSLHLLMNAAIEFPSTNSPRASLDDFELTEREKEVLILLVEGLEYKEIAQEMKISPNTVRNHLVNIYRKLHVASKAQAIRVFMKNK